MFDLIQFISTTLVTIEISFMTPQQCSWYAVWSFMFWSKTAIFPKRSHLFIIGTEMHLWIIRIPVCAFLFVVVSVIKLVLNQTSGNPIALHQQGCKLICCIFWNRIFRWIYVSEHWFAIQSCLRRVSHLSN